VIIRFVHGDLYFKLTDLGSRSYYHDDSVMLSFPVIIIVGCDSRIHRIIVMFGVGMVRHGPPSALTFPRTPRYVTINYFALPRPTT